jgi:hypothetical protein
MSDTQLVQIQSDEALLAQGGLGQEEREGVPDPYLVVLVQPTTGNVPDGVHPGEFLLKDSGLSLSNKMRVIPIKANYVRNKYPSRVYNPNEKATCVSYDGIVPVKNSKFLVPEAENCVKCKLKEWDNTLPFGDPNAKPLCRANYRITFIHVESGMPIYITFTGKNVKRATTYWGLVQNRLDAINKFGKKGAAPLSVFNFVSLITTKKEGATYRVEFPQTDQLTPEQAAQVGPLFLQLTVHRERFLNESALAKQNEQGVEAAAGAILDGEYDEDAPVEV